MSETQGTSFTVSGFRVVALASACVLGGLAGWILAAELLRPAVIGFAMDAQSAMSAYARRDRSIAAARVGVIRGELWSEAALSYGDVLWSQPKSSTNDDAAQFERTRALIERAISYAPYDSRLWILLAADYFRLDWLNERAAAALRMSYYTGSNALPLVPGRLLLAIQNPALEDKDFQELVRHDIRLAVTHKSELMGALIAAYTDVPVSGRQFLEKTLAELDPSTLALIRSQTGQR